MIGGTPPRPPPSCPRTRGHRREGWSGRPPTHTAAAAAAVTAAVTAAVMVMALLVLHVTYMALETVLLIANCSVLMQLLQIHGLVMDFVMMVLGVCI